MKHLPYAIMCIFLVGCSSPSIMGVGGYRIINAHDPRCVGMSASTVIVDKGSPDTMLSLKTTTKSGYCEQLSEQVIDGASTIAGQYFRGKGQGKAGSGNNTITNQTTTSASPPDDCEEPGMC